MKCFCIAFLWSLLLVLSGTVSALAVSVTFLLTPPANEPTGSQIHLAGNFQNWQPGAALWRLAPTTDGRFTLTVEMAEGQRLQFKFTKGSWLTVEKGLAGEELSNRLHVVVGTDTVRVEVAAWASGTPEHRADTITGFVEEISWPEFLGGRRVWVYLPPSYEERPDEYYPVLYMFDGQNVFNAATSFVGEWQVDETLEGAIADGRVRPVIVVAVDNGGDQRLKEYTPWGAVGFRAAGGGRDHLRQWVRELMPRINRKYRTLSGPGFTGLVGSSLGGLMSLYGGFAYPEVFGRVAAFSPTLHVPAGKLFEYCARQPAQPRAVYLDMGTREQGNLVDDDGNDIDDHIDALRRLNTVLGQRGYVGGWDLFVVEAEGARHNEQAWARRFPAAVEFLFPPE